MFTVVLWSTFSANDQVLIKEELYRGTHIEDMHIFEETVKCGSQKPRQYFKMRWKAL